MGSSSSTSKPQEKPPSVLLHRLHGENVQISADWRSVTRFTGFERAICFSNKPITRNRYIDIRIKETDPSWRGVLRLGVTTQHPGTLKREHLPQCACPGLQERDGFWIESIPETIATKGNEIYFYVASDGDVVCGVTANGKRQGFEEEVVTRGASTNKDLWMVIEVYGQTTQVELFEPASALTVLHNKPGHRPTQKERSAKLVNRGREDPIVENTINLAIQKQKEQGEGSSQDPDISSTLPPNDETGENHPAPKPVGVINSGSATDVTAGTSGEGQSEAVTDGVKPDGGDNQPMHAAECTVCLVGRTDCALYKCGHVCMCYNCAFLMLKSAKALCPMCREPIEDVIKTFQS